MFSLACVTHSPPHHGLRIQTTAPEGRRQKKTLAVLATFSLRLAQDRFVAGEIPCEQPFRVKQPRGHEGQGVESVDGLGPMVLMFTVAHVDFLQQIEEFA